MLKFRIDRRISHKRGQEVGCSFSWFVFCFLLRATNFSLCCSVACHYGRDECEAKLSTLGWLKNLSA